MLKKTVVFSFPVLCVISLAFVFIYEGTNSSPFVAVIAPVDTSVSEQTKLLFLPVVLWWGYIYMENFETIRRKSWFVASLAAVVSGILTFTFLSLLNMQFIDKRYITADILILVISLATGQWIGVFIYKRKYEMKYRFLLSGYVLIFMFYILKSFMK